MEYIVIVILSLLLGVIIWNYLYMQTPRYKSELACVQKFKGADTNNYVILNTGSNHAYYAIDWSLVGVNGFNLASGSQSILWDKKLLHRYLKTVDKGIAGKVVITLSNLVLCFIDYPHDIANKRYYFFAEPEDIPRYSLWKKIKYRYFPILSNWRNFFYVFYKRDINKLAQSNKRSAEQEAELRITGWKDQFNLLDLQHAKSAEHLQPIIEETVKIVRKMVDECREHGVMPILMIPPLSGVLNAKISNEFLQEVLYKPIQNNFQDIALLDYMRDERFQDTNLYSNSDFMNLDGRTLFTKILWYDVRGIKDER